MGAKGRRRHVLRLARGLLVLGERTLVMGVLNVTPDSFSDGGRYLSVKAAVRHAAEMARAGADILDIGGESARPGAGGIPAEEELRRVLPVLRAVRRRVSVPISIDTRKAEVAAAALEEGAVIVNDISGLREDPEVAPVAARARAPLILMHMRGSPRTMQQKPFPKDVWRSVESGLRWSVGQALKAGVLRSRLIIAPGIGFGKTWEQNLELLRGLRRLEKFRLPVLVGASRKTFIGKALGDARPEDRLWGTAATVTAAILNGAHIVRVHDVAEMVQVARLSDAILTGKLAPKRTTR